MKVFLISTILALFFLTNAIYAADSKSNRKDNVVSFGVKGGVGWPAITSPIFIAIPGENGVLDWIMEVKRSRQMERCLNHLLQV